MKGTQLQHRYFKNGFSENFNAYKHQRSFCSRLDEREKTNVIFQQFEFK